MVSLQLHGKNHNYLNFLAKAMDVSAGDGSSLALLTALISQIFKLLYSRFLPMTNNCNQLWCGGGKIAISSTLYAAAADSLE